MIGLLRDDDTFAAGILRSHPQSQIICLRTSTHVHYFIDLIRKQFQNFLTVVHDSFMQISGMGVQLLHLPSHCLDDCRMTMADTRHIIVHIQIFCTVGIPQILSFSSHQIHGFPVKQPVGSAHVLLSSLYQFIRLPVQKMTGGIRVTVCIHNT